MQQIPSRMSEERCNLKWNSHTDYLREMLHYMMKSEQLTDVTLVCDDRRKFKAHKIVLSACSPVFKDIIHDLPLNDSVIYLRGVQHQEIESIIEFMYLGEATFQQERMNEFLSVAKNLEIKEISKSTEYSSTDQEIGVESENNFQAKSNVKSDEIENIIESRSYQDYEDEKLDAFPSQYENCVETIKEKNTGLKTKYEYGKIKEHEKNGKYSKECPECHKVFSQKYHVKIHYNSVHKHITFDCDQCGYRATQKASLKTHIRSIHEGKKYPCNQCEYQATRLDNLNVHIEAKHENIKYTCEYCNYQLNSKVSLYCHIRSKHKK